MRIRIQNYIRITSFRKTNTHANTHTELQIRSYTDFDSDQSCQKSSIPHPINAKLRVRFQFCSFIHFIGYLIMINLNMN